MSNGPWTILLLLACTSGPRPLADGDPRWDRPDCPPPPQPAVDDLVLDRLDRRLVHWLGAPPEAVVAELARGVPELEWRGCDVALGIEAELSGPLDEVSGVQVIAPAPGAGRALLRVDLDALPRLSGRPEVVRLAAVPCRPLSWSDYAPPPACYEASDPKHIPEYRVGSSVRHEGVPSGPLHDHLTRYTGQLAYCHEHARKRDEGVRGKVDFAWMVRDGRATDIVVRSNDTGSELLAQCVISRIARWTLPAEVTGEVTVGFAFELKLLPMRQRGGP